MKNEQKISILISFFLAHFKHSFNYEMYIESVCFVKVIFGLWMRLVASTINFPHLFVCSSAGALKRDATLFTYLRSFFASHFVFFIFSCCSSCFVATPKNSFKGKNKEKFENSRSGYSHINIKREKKAIVSNHFKE